MLAKKDDVYTPPQEVDPETLKSFSEFLKEECGIHIADSKKTLVESRLLNRLRELQCRTFREYFTYLKKNQLEKQIFINLMTTNKTEFFREDYQFEYLIDHIKKNRPCDGGFWSLWSAASSTGEEAYTLAMLLDTLKRDRNGYDYQILGTDIDTRVLESAEVGLYLPERVQEQVPPRFQSYFQEHSSGQLLISEEVKQRVKYRSFNLVNDTFPFKGFFDFVFLRNVLIYFDEKTVHRVIGKLKKNMKVGGLLFLGASEALHQKYEGLKQVESSVYERTK